MTNSVAILEKLISFKTVSRRPNIALIDYARQILAEAGIECRVFENEDGTNANLFATIGPQESSGVLLSGHTDVVPVEGQDWSTDPFTLIERDGLLFGRGTADMKGFVACVLNAASKAASANLTTPIHIALSYDEEIGCVGVRHMLDILAAADFQPRFCIIGEPTNLSVATGHKGKTAARATCHGVEAHSSLAPTALNAIHLASDFIQGLRQLQDDLEQSGKRDGDYDVAYSTVHAGVISGGTALNIVPNQCVVDFEVRNLQEDDPHEMMATIRKHAEAISATAQKAFPSARIEVETLNAYPGLNTPPDSEVVTFVKSLTGANVSTKVSFGTEGGLFSERIRVPTVVCGPGSMEQGHKPNEYIARSQIEKCDAMLDTLIKRLSA